MFNPLKKSSSKDTYLALDLGTETIKSSVFCIDEKYNLKGEVIGKTASILSLCKKALKEEEAEWGITDVSKIIQNSQSVSQAAVKEARQTPGKLILGIDGSFIKGGTTIHKQKRDDPNVKINLTELRNIVHKLQWSAFAKVRKLISQETGYEEINTKLVMADIVDIKIDGYQVSNPLGFQGKELEMSIFNCFTSLGHYNALQKIVNSFSMECLGIVPSAYSFSRALKREGEKANANVILIDIGGSSTDIVLIREGLLIGSRSFGMGGRTFSKRIAVELNISFKEAEKLKCAYSEDRLEQKSKNIVHTILMQDIETWLEGVILSLDALKNKKSLPSKILLSGGGALLPEIKESLNDSKWYKSLLFKDKPQAHFVNPKEVSNVSDEVKKIRNHQDFTMISLVNTGLFFSEKETLIQKALKKIVGIMKV